MEDKEILEALVNREIWKEHGKIFEIDKNGVNELYEKCIGELNSGDVYISYGAQPEHLEMNVGIIYLTTITKKYYDVNNNIFLEVDKRIVSQSY